MNQNESFLSLKIAVLTVSDTRSEANDKSGKTLVDNLTSTGHTLAEKTIVPDNFTKDAKELLDLLVAHPKILLMLCHPQL